MPASGRHYATTSNESSLPSSSSSDRCSSITQASLSSLLLAPAFTSSFNNQMTGKCTICCSLPPAATFWLATCTSPTCSQQPWASKLPARHSLPATSSSARQRQCRRYPPAMVPLRAPRWAPLQASVESRPALHLHRAPPRWYPLQQPSRHSCASSPGDATACIDQRRIALLSVSPRTTALACLHLLLHRRERTKPPNHHAEKSLFFHRPSPRLIAEEGLPTPSSYATNSSLA
ncbi:hypothetical protein LI328DRAFT_171907 [Trichoderma asperelloides]|nr:hypothetical protein LI328DRAFT_171907 [Trichoderma asperelloides]